MRYIARRASARYACALPGISHSGVSSFFLLLYKAVIGACHTPQWFQRALRSRNSLWHFQDHTKNAVKASSRLLLHKSFALQNCNPDHASTTHHYTQQATEHRKLAHIAQAAQGCASRVSSHSPSLLGSPLKCAGSLTILLQGPLCRAKEPKVFLRFLRVSYMEASRRVPTTRSYRSKIPHKSRAGSKIAPLRPQKVAIHRGRWPRQPRAPPETLLPSKEDGRRVVGWLVTCAGGGRGHQGGGGGCGWAALAGGKQGRQERHSGGQTAATPAHWATALYTA